VVSRRRRRTERLKAEIKFYLQIMRVGEWVENRDIIRHLTYSARGKMSYNTLTAYALGQMIRQIDGAEKRIINHDGHGKITQYRLVMEEE
jgi:hypothetical protein